MKTITDKCDRLTRRAHRAGVTLTVGELATAWLRIDATRRLGRDPLNRPAGYVYDGRASFRAALDAHATPPWPTGHP